MVTPEGSDGQKADTGTPEMCTGCSITHILPQATRDRVQELCESRGGRPGVPSLISLRFLLT